MKGIGPLQTLQMAKLLGNVMGRSHYLGVYIARIRHSVMPIWDIGCFWEQADL